MRDHAAALASPAGGGVYADLRTEMRWGLDWLVKMLGGAEMLHQVSGPHDHDVDDRAPEDDATLPAWTKTNESGVYEARPAYRFRAGHGANFLGRAAAALAI